jgi:hypothetical protein
MSDKRQKNQLVLAFTEEGRSEAPKAPQEGTESLTAKCETERPARHEQLMEGVCERQNCWQAYKRVKANPLNRRTRTRIYGGVAGVDGRPSPLCRFMVGALLVNRAAARFILRTGSAGSKGFAPSRHDSGRPAFNFKLSTPNCFASLALPRHCNVHTAPFAFSPPSL